MYSVEHCRVKWVLMIKPLSKGDTPALFSSKKANAIPANIKIMYASKTTSDSRYITCPGLRAVEEAE